MHADEMSLCEQVKVQLERDPSTLARAPRRVREHLQTCARCQAETAWARRGERAPWEDASRCWLVMEAFVGAEVSIERLDAHLLKCDACEESIVKLLEITKGSRCRELWRLLRRPATQFKALDVTASPRVVPLARGALTRTILYALLTEGDAARDWPVVKRHMGGRSCKECSTTTLAGDGGSMLEVDQVGPIEIRRDVSRMGWQEMEFPGAEDDVDLDEVDGRPEPRK